MSNDRIHYLNGLRGILAVVVFVHHFFYAFCPEFIFGGTWQEYLSGKSTFSKLLAYTPLNLIFNPGMAINFFFLLSGYVQSYIYVKTGELPFLQKSFIKRYFRLAAPVVAVVLLVFAFHRLQLIHNGSIPHNTLSAAWVKGMMPDSKGVFGALHYALVSCFNGDVTYYQVLWTMSIELYNSWMVLILLMVTHRTANKLPLFILWFLAQAFLIQSFYSMSFTAGLLICHLHHQSEKFNRLIAHPLTRLLCLVVGLYFASYPFTGYEGATQKSMYRLISFFDKVPHVISYAFGNLLLFLFLLKAERLQKIISKPLFLFFGEVSFMFYLVHFLILFSFSAWLYQQLFPHLLRTANVWTTGLVSFGMITLVSYALYKLIDLPVVRWCNVYTRRFFAT